MAILEPQERIWDGVSGQLFSLQHLTGTDHLKPFDKIAEFNKRAKYSSKTLFRLPLRDAPSNISDNIFTVSKVNKLIEALKSEAHRLLLFLRSVHTIQVINIDGFHKRQDLVFQTKIVDDCVKQERAAFLKKLKDYHRGASECFNFSQQIQCTYRCDVCVDSGRGGITTSHWLVANRFDSTNKEVREASVEQGIFPWVGTAVELDNPGKGRLFCSLPMPTNAAPNLPVHVNGTFNLNDDLRSVKWPVVGSNEDDRNAHWNQILVSHVLPSCYADLLLQVKRHLKPELFYKAWPDVDHLKGTQWEDLLNPLFTAIWEQEVIFSESDNWVIPTTAIYMRSLGELPDPVKTAVANCGMNLAKVPGKVWNAFSYTELSVVEFTPSYIRDSLRRHEDRYTGLEQSDKLELLRYSLSDGKHCENELVNLKLLPLADGSFIEFKANLDGNNSDASSSEDLVYVCSEANPRKLLPNLDHKLVDLSNDKDLLAKLMQVAQSSTTQLRVLDTPAVSALLAQAMPSSAEEVTLLEGESGLDWFQTFWKWVESEELSLFQNNLILPVQCGTTPAESQFCVTKLLQPKPVLYIPFPATEHMLSTMSKFSIQYYSKKFFPFVQHKDLTTFIKICSPNTLLKIIALKANYSSVPLSLEEVECLRKYLSTIQLPLENISTTVLRDLPLFSSWYQPVLC